jgi:serine/threonine protein phosphatase 1
MTGRLFAIGDIHGCARELEHLLGALPIAAGDTVAFVGDYLDRGPDSRAVVDLCLVLQGRTDITTVFLKGNHEDMCLGYLERGGEWGEAWCHNGGTATLKSYGIDARLSGAAAAAEMPPRHVAFFEGLVLGHEAGQHLLVHAGVRPDLPWEKQVTEDLLWIREEFIENRHVLPHTIVFGHTPHRAVLLDLPYKIGIDTGCVYGGMLTAVELAEGVQYQVRLGDKRVRQSALGAPAPRRWFG